MNIPTRSVNDGQAIPAIGFGTYPLLGKEGYEALQRLGLDQIDVILIHWPNPINGKFMDAWQGLARLREQGVVRNIGVSNFAETHLGDIIADSGVTPVLNQIELHPLFTQKAMRAVHDRLGIVTE